MLNKFYNNVPYIKDKFYNGVPQIKNPQMKLLWVGKRIRALLIIPDKIMDHHGKSPALVDVI